MRPVFERVSMVMRGYTGRWISFSGTFVVPAPGLGKKLIQKFLSHPCAAFTGFNHTEDRARRGWKAHQAAPK